MTHKMKQWTASVLVLILLMSTAACGFGEHPTETTQPSTDPTQAPTTQPITEPTTDPTTVPTISPTMPVVPQIQANIRMEQVRISGYHENWIAQFNNLLGQSLRVGTEQELADALDQVRSLNKEFTLTGEYDAAFFLENVLVLIPVQSTSGSVRFEAEATLEDGAITISITGKLEGVGTADMADWLLLAVLPRAEYPQDAPVKVQASGVKLPDNNMNVNDR